MHSGEGILTAEIAEKPESGVLAVAKAPISDFGQPVATKSFGQAVKLAVTVLREEFYEEFGRGRGGTKRAKDGKPMAPGIYSRYSEYHILPKSISLETVPRGVLSMWRSAYHSATPPVQREFLFLSEAMRSLTLHSLKVRLKVIPICFLRLSIRRLIPTVTRLLNITSLRSRPKSTIPIQTGSML